MLSLLRTQLVLVNAVAIDQEVAVQIALVCDHFQRLPQR